MKASSILCLVTLVCSVNPATAQLMPVVVDDFNAYANGSIIGQGNWNFYRSGDNFIVQDAVVFEGDKALYSNTNIDSVVGKHGILRTDGRQVVYVRTENRDSWGDYWPGNAQVRITRDSWATWPANITVSFKRDGHVAYSYTDFATYDDNVWTLLEMEWRSSDKTARYRVNSEKWTDWEPIWRSDMFDGFDYVGFDFTTGGSGGVYFDTLGLNPIPEPATITFLITGLMAGGLFLLRRK